MRERAALIELAEACGLSSSYEDSGGRAVEADPAVLAAILEGLGVGAGDPEAALEERRRLEWAALLEPVMVAWAGRGWLRVRLPAALRGIRFDVELTNEDGAGATLAKGLADAPIVGRHSVAEVEVLTRRLALPQLATGYHRARIRVRHGSGALEGETLILAAPRRTYAPPRPLRATAVFAPVYALQSAGSLGIGNVGDLGRLLRWTRTHGGTTVGTLPLLATDHDDPEGVSPYAPISRLAWDELFLDLAALPELATSAPARAAIEGARAEGARLRALRLVDYAAVEQATKPVLSALAEEAHAPSSPRRPAMERFAEARPLVADYARFRGARARLGGDWRRWPDAAREGTLGAQDIDEATTRLHLYAQFALGGQLSALATEARSEGAPGLYLDLPLGTHRAGFDAWRFPEAFADGLDAGAPPDRIATAGQNWHFAPGDPEGLRRSGYRYFIEAVRNHVRHAGVLRIDHVMGLHRLYVMPRGAAASEGAYLHYRSEELWAVLAIESQRARSVIVGEDLGTVPAAVRTAMRRHGAGSSWVLQYEVGAEARALSRPARSDVAALNTHDMPTFAGWVDGADLELRRELGLIEAEGEVVSREERGATVAALRRVLRLAEGSSSDELLRGALRYLGGCPAGLVLVALADLLGEPSPENVPGTTIEHANWRRRLGVAVDGLDEAPAAADLLRALTGTR